MPKNNLYSDGKKGVAFNQKRFRQTITINQVGAKPIRTNRGYVFQLGGGMFTKKQVLASRKRYGRVKYNVKADKSAFGM